MQVQMHDDNFNFGSFIILYYFKFQRRF